MCEVLFFVKEKGALPSDPYIAAKSYRRGDVVCVMPDGWAWTTEELTNPWWRILQLPNITVSQAASFVAPEVDTDPTHPSKVLQRRHYKIDVDAAIAALPTRVITYLKDDTRAQGTCSMALTAAQFLVYRVTKPPLVDPNIL